MVCIYCGSKTSVNNSRHQKRKNHIWRRRQCGNCKAVFTTSEVPDLYLGIVVEGAGKIEPFSRDKLFISIHDSLKHRKSALTDATQLTDTIINTALSSNNEAKITKQTLSEITYGVLANFDKPASVYYNSFHQNQIDFS